MKLKTHFPLNKVWKYDSNQKFHLITLYGASNNGALTYDK